MQDRYTVSNCYKISAAICVLYVARFNAQSILPHAGRFNVFATCSPRTMNFHVLATTAKHLSSLSSPIGKLCAHCSCWKVVYRAKMLLIDGMCCAVVLKYSLNRHTECVRQIYIYMKNLLFSLLVWGSPQLHAYGMDVVTVK